MAPPPCVRGLNALAVLPRAAVAVVAAADWGRCWLNWDVGTPATMRVGSSAAATTAPLPPPPPPPSESDPRPGSSAHPFCAPPRRLALEALFTGLGRSVATSTPGEVRTAARWAGCPTPEAGGNGDWRVGDAAPAAAAAAAAAGTRAWVRAARCSRGLNWFTVLHQFWSDRPGGRTPVATPPAAAPAAVAPPPPPPTPAPAPPSALASAVKSAMGAGLPVLWPTWVCKPRAPPPRLVAALLPRRFAEELAAAPRGTLQHTHTHTHTHTGGE